jgi:hypothetical protein
MRRIYAERRQRVLDCLDADLSDWFKSWPSTTGLHIAGILNGGGLRMGSQNPPRVWRKGPTLSGETVSPSVTEQLKSAGLKRVFDASAEQSRTLCRLESGATP